MYKRQQHNTASYATRQVTERLLDAVVPVVALSPRVVSWLRYEMHSGAKIQMFDETPVYYNSVSEKIVSEKQEVSSMKHAKNS